MYSKLAPQPLTSRQQAALDEDGFVVLPELMDDAIRRAAADEFDRILAAEGDRAAEVPGTEYKPEPGAPRIAYCVNRGPVFEYSYTHNAVLAGALHVIGRPFKLHGFNARDVKEGQGHQDLHPDYTRESGDQPYHLINTLWLLDDFTETNGPTRIVPGSHKIAGRITDHVEDLRAPHPDEVHLTGRKGTVVIFNGHCWHGGTQNVDGARRRVLHVSYVGRDRDQQLDCHKVTTPETRQRLTPEVRYLLDI